MRFIDNNSENADKQENDNISSTNLQDTSFNSIKRDSPKPLKSLSASPDHSLPSPSSYARPFAQNDNQNKVFNSLYNSMQKKQQEQEKMDKEEEIGKEMNEINVKIGQEQISLRKITEQSQELSFSVKCSQFQNQMIDFQETRDGRDER